MRTALALLALSAAGCAARPRPLPDQPWMTLAEYAARGAEKDRLPPVLAIPEGATIRVKITPRRCPQDHFLAMVSDESELAQPTEDVVVTVRASKAFHLDLMSFLVSRDREKWSQLWFNIGVFSHRVSELTVSDGGATASVPAEAGFFVVVEPPGSTR